MRIVTTRDGSPTLYSERYQQHYHHLAGALTESRHVFFDRTGLSRTLAAHRDFNIFEVGFGTGFHILLLEFLRKKHGSRSRIRFYSVEKYPVESDLVRKMSHSRILPDMEDIIEDVIRFSGKLHAAHPGEYIAISLPLTTLVVFRGDFFDLEQNKIDGPIHFFLHDAFSPNVNPELWTPPVFRKLLAVADKRAVLGTYCSATKARAAMVLGGWHTARAAGPPGKREMTLASPCEECLASYKRVNEQLLKERFRDQF